MPLSLNDLRCFGRFLHLQRPTDKKKGPLIEEILGVICSEIKQERTNRGEPIKHNVFLKEIPEKIQKISEEVFSKDYVLFLWEEGVEQILVEKPK